MKTSPQHVRNTMTMIFFLSSNTGTLKLRSMGSCIVFSPTIYIFPKYASIPPEIPLIRWISCIHLLVLVHSYRAFRFNWIKFISAAAGSRVTSVEVRGSSFFLNVFVVLSVGSYRYNLLQRRTLKISKDYVVSCFIVLFTSA